VQRGDSKMGRRARVLLAAALLVAVGGDAHALVVCGQKLRTTGALRDGSSLHVRAACRPNEVAVDPAIFGTSAGGATMSFSGETQLVGTAQLFLTTDGRINSADHEARTPVGPGTLRNLRCYLSEAPGGGGITIAVGVGGCGAPLTYGAPSLSFAAGDGQLAKVDASATVAVAAGQCVALRVDLLGTTSATYLNCTLERVPG
jgi:hypothetical protein